MRAELTEAAVKIFDENYNKNYKVNTIENITTKHIQLRLVDIREIII
jgi:hypothetical protein